MDNDKANSEDNSLKGGSSTTVRNSLVIGRAEKRRSLEKRSRSFDSRDGSGSSDSSESSPRRKKRKKTKKLKKKASKKKKKAKKRSKRSSTSDEDSDEERRRKKKKSKKCKKKFGDKEPTSSTTVEEVAEASFGPVVPEEIIARSKAMVPMTKEEWEKRQSLVRRVFDEDSGRYRLVRGDGEIIEECVSRERHKQINKQATAADGMYFQKRLDHK